MSIPRFAVLGHPNEGKSSVVSTLTENEQVRISRTPGETTRSIGYAISRDGKPVLEIIDTPGFQNPSATLEWLQAYSGPEAEMIDSFIETHAQDPAFHHDVELLRPLTRQAGILYVADTSRPLRETDRQEMELLRLTGLPRLALLNQKREVSSYETEWREALNRRFNLIRTFNAHRASFAERMDLLTALSLLNPDEEDTLQAIRDDLIRDWQNRLEQSILVLENLLQRAIRHQVRRPFKSGIPESDQKASAGEQYREEIRTFEINARREWRDLFHHPSLPDRDNTDEEILEDLFTEKVWRLLGLSRNQIAGAGLTAGATLGAGLDVAAGGITFGVFAAAGAVLGGVSSWIGSPKLGAKRIPFPGGKKWAREQIRVGPHPEPQLVFVLLDRSLMYIIRLMNWAHGRRDHESFLAENPMKTKSRNWPESQRKTVYRWIKEHVPGNSPTEQTVDAFHRLMLDYVQTYSAAGDSHEREDGSDEA